MMADRPVGPVRAKVERAANELSLGTNSKGEKEEDKKRRLTVNARNLPVLFNAAFPVHSQSELIYHKSMIRQPYFHFEN